MQNANTAKFDWILTTPIEQALERTGRAMCAEDAEHYQAVALHESAHIVAAIACDGFVGGAIIRPRKTTYAHQGSVNTAGLLPHHDAIMAYVGYAWEELHGDVNMGSDDLDTGRQADPPNCLVNLQRARKLVVQADCEIRYCATGILGILPKTGRLDGRNFKGLQDWLRPRIRQHAIGLD